MLRKLKTPANTKGCGAGWGVIRRTGALGSSRCGFISQLCTSRCVALGESLCLPEPPSPHLRNVTGSRPYISHSLRAENGNGIEAG